MQKIILFHNYPTPYRIPFFEAINTCYDLEVWFTQDPGSENRVWDHKLLQNVSFKYKILDSKTIRILGKPFIINKGLASLLMKTKFQMCINVDNVPTLYSLFLGFIVTKIKKKKFILWTAYYPNQHLISTTQAVNQLYKCILFLYQAPLFFFSDHILCYTQAAKNKIQKYFNKQVTHLPQVYPSSLLAPFIKTDNQYKKQPAKNILYVGYLNPRKNVSFLIKTFKSISRNDWRLIIVGDGSEKSKLEKLAGNDRRIQFKGYLTGHEKYSHFLNADVLVLVSEKDCWGLVINEAMSFGLPVIVSENVEAKELVSGNGVIIKQNSSEGLANALEEILDKPDNEVKKMRKRSVTNIRQYSIKSMVNAFNRAIQQLLL